MVTESDVYAIRFAAVGNTASPLSEDPAMLDAIAERGLMPIFLPPAPVKLMGLSAFLKRGLESVSFPRMSCDARFPDLIDLIEQSGEPRTVEVTLGAPTATIPLLTMLIDAAEIAHRLLGTPVSASAAVTAASPVVSLDRPHSLAGAAHMLLRHSNGRSCVVRLCDRGMFERAVRITTQERLITLDCAGISICGLDGELLDAPNEQMPTVERYCANQLARASKPGMRHEPIDTRTTLAVVEACLLSARTGAPESPDTMLQISGERAGV